jgi:hypothetical protein
MSLATRNQKDTVATSHSPEKAGITRLKCPCCSDSQLQSAHRIPIQIFNLLKSVNEAPSEGQLQKPIFILRPILAHWGGNTYFARLPSNSSSWEWFKFILPKDFERSFHYLIYLRYWGHNHCDRTTFHSIVVISLWHSKECLVKSVRIFTMHTCFYLTIA